MKKILHLMFIALIFVSCSSDDDKKTSYIPEKFDIKIEIKALEGTTVPKVSISVNSLEIEKWDYQSLPFVGYKTYKVNDNEIINSSCGCIRINAWAYIGSANELQEFNLYIDDVLVDSKSVPASSTNGIMNPTALEFIFTP